MAQPKSDIAPLLREAVALQDRGAFDQAVERCERALRQAPRSVEALHLLGVGECLRGRPEAGLKHFDRAIARLEGQGCIALGPAKPAVAFDGAQVIFLFTPLKIGRAHV
mgnify:CR=1 FL=1